MSPYFAFGIRAFRLKTILKGLHQFVSSLRARLFLYALACSLTILYFDAPLLGQRYQVSLSEIRQHLANLLFGRGVLHG
jgi:hypothetical protein